MMIYGLKKKLRENERFMYWVRCFRHRRPDYLPESYFEIVSRGGARPDLVVYEIVHHAEECGFFSMYLQIIAQLYVADRFHFDPYVSITNSYYNEKKDDPTDNAFEYYYQQPCGLTYQEVQQASNIVKAFWEHRAWMLRRFGFNNRTIVYAASEDFLKEYARIKQKYIHYASDIEEKLREASSRVLCGRKTIAVHYRGTDLKVMAPNHPIPLVPEDYYGYMDECLSQGYEQFFLATDDQNALNSFLERYPNRIVYYEEAERSDDDMGAFCKGSTEDGSRYSLGLDVIRDVYTMAACEGLICGNGNVAVSTRIEKLSKNEHFSYEQVIDKGTNADNAESYRRAKEYFNKDGAKLR